MKTEIFWCEWDGKTESHELLRRAVGRYLHREMEELSLKQGEFGKPALEDWPQVHFSISHSERIWACAVGPCALGLDLQKQYEKKGDRLARRFFHAEEIAWLEQNDFEQFSRVWTYKESYVKYTGIGLRRGLDYFSVIPGIRCGEIHTEESGGRIFQKEIPFLEGYWMVLTSREQQETGLHRFYDSEGGRRPE